MAHEEDHDYAPEEHEQSSEDEPGEEFCVFGHVDGAWYFALWCELLFAGMRLCSFWLVFDKLAAGRLHCLVKHTPESKSSYMTYLCAE